MNIGNAVKENKITSMKCKANSANPSSLVGMEFFIDSTRQSNIIPEATEIPGSDNGMVKTFVFTFKTDRNHNGMIARCHLLWDGDYTNEKREVYLNITCEYHKCLGGKWSLVFY